MNELEIEKLQKEIEELKSRLNGFVPVIVDLRINGKVRPVILFAKQEEPQFNQPFEIVK